MIRNPLEQIVNSYLARVQALETENEHCPQSHFTHIARNLLQVMYTPEAHHDSKAALDIYLGLVDEFPDFRSAEMTTQIGFFSDAPEDYVSYAAEQLRR